MVRTMAGMVNGARQLRNRALGRAVWLMCGLYDGVVNLKLFASTGGCANGPTLKGPAIPAFVACVMLRAVIILM